MFDICEKKEDKITISSTLDLINLYGFLIKREEIIRLFKKFFKDQTHLSFSEFYLISIHILNDYQTLKCFENELKNKVQEYDLTDTTYFVFHRVINEFTEKKLLDIDIENLY